MRNARLYFPALVFLLGSALVWNTRSQAAVPLVAPLAGIMATLDGYRVQDQRLSDAEVVVAGMSQYVARTYWRDSLPAFQTFVSYYERQTQGKTIHSPRNCLPGSGWQILSPGTQDIVVGGSKQTVNHYLLRNGAQTAVVLYWYQGRGRIVASEYTVKLNLLRDAAVAGHTEEALVRVVVPVNASASGGDALVAANRLGTEIATRLAEEVSRVLPRSSARQVAASR